MRLFQDYTPHAVLALSLALSCGCGTSSPDPARGGRPDIDPSGTSGSGSDASVAHGDAGAGGSADVMGGASSAGAAPEARSDGGAFPPSLDPHAAERKQLATAACNLPERYPCLSVGTDPTLNVGDAKGCVGQTETESHRRYGASCWDAWVAHIKCGIERTDYCPCMSSPTANYCGISPSLNNFGKGCLEMKAALDACELSLGTFGTETGAAGEFTWRVSPGGGCKVDSVEQGVVGRVTADCDGPPGGAQSCLCSANGYPVVDLVELTLNGGAYVRWLADDCRAAARKMAAGVCTTELACCFRYVAKTADGRDVDTCGCGSDPSRAGYAGCADFAAAASGTIVDACVEWQTPGNFPIHPKNGAGN